MFRKPGKTNSPGGLDLSIKTSEGARFQATIRKVVFLRGLRHLVLAAAFAASMVWIATSPLAAKETHRPTWKDGTVLVLRDSNAVVSAVTGSRITHVAIVFQVSGVPTVYEATPGRVRRLALEPYLKEIAIMNERRRQPMTVYAMAPRRDYSEADIGAMRQVADDALGRRYSVKGYVKEQPSAGVHCSEYASQVLSASACHSMRSCHRMTPIKLREALLFTHRAPSSLPLPRRRASNWGQRTSECWSDFSNWCGWACWESWSFCR